MIIMGTILKLTIGAYMIDKAFFGGKTRLTKAIDKGAVATFTTLFAKKES